MTLNNNDETTVEKQKKNFLWYTLLGQTDHQSKSMNRFQSNTFTLFQKFSSYTVSWAGVSLFLVEKGWPDCR